ncbi:pimelyl-ACP methyl ester esterase BioV [uncultured Sulfurimonas sp.]|jgi:hypothetical protein|uniref:pimelyl-ACP methyl ester esterase BioV n=1 Tax=uncultured Sulfurimonas sp. TaxID=291845 RepID=UPI0032B23C4D
MTFFSGFSLKNEQHLFKEFINESKYCVCGFSYGSMKALKHAKKLLEDGKSVDILQLLSPVFFQTKSQRFKRVQTMAYNTNNKEYMSKFLDSCFEPYPHKEIEFQKNTIGDLEELLNHQWILNEFEDLVNKGIKLEVYIGSADKIIDVKSAREFFTQVATVTYIKDANHFLQVD